jgi:hypothetical protein
MPPGPARPDERPTTHKWRQWSVSKTKLLTRSPHHAPSKAADPMPYVSRPATAFPTAAPSVKVMSAETAMRPGSPCSATARTYVLVRRSRQCSRTARAPRRRGSAGPARARRPRRRTGRSHALDACALGDKVGRAAYRDRAHEEHPGRGRLFARIVTFADSTAPSSPSTRPSGRRGRRPREACPSASATGCRSHRRPCSR